MSLKKRIDPGLSAPIEAPGPDAAFVRQLRQGDRSAGRQLVQEYYPGVYRYLLYLTGDRESAEDLAQETFVQAWRRLETFDGHGTLRAWLHRIAHREFLQAVRSRRPEASLEGIPEPVLAHAGDGAEAVALRTVMGRLPPEQREALVLHYMEGYSYQEIAGITGSPVTTVKYRLSAARAALQRELGEGDLPYLNQAPEAGLRSWSWLPLEALAALEAHLALVGDRWLMTGQTEASRGGDETMNDRTETGMSRRSLLKSAGTAAVSAAASLTGTAEGAKPPASEAEIVDSRLGQTITLAVKGTALADLCEQLREETGIAIIAGPSVADEKVTLFCERLPLREVMRQLSRPFGYTWLRGGSAGRYRYELVQDLRSQLFEEELRNRDRNTALLALEREMERYRPYLDLSPDEARARARTAPPAEKPLLEQFSGLAWGAIQIYFRLTPQQMASLRAGETLIFSEPPSPGEPPRPEAIEGSPLAKDLARGVLQTLRTLRLIKDDEGRFGSTQELDDLRAMPLTAVPEVRAMVHLFMKESEPGQFTLAGFPGAFIRPHGAQRYTWCGMQVSGVFASGRTPSIAAGASRAARGRLGRQAGLSTPISFRPEPSCRPEPFPAIGETPEPQEAAKPKVTTADVLDALHRATGRPIIGDFYTRLYEPETTAVRELPLLDALTRIAEATRLKWNVDGDWLQFRSETYYEDRLKEVPDRLLLRWSQARRQRGLLSLDEVIEISQLTDAQLDGHAMAEGAELCWGLKEWRLLRNSLFRPHVRFLAGFTPEQRQEAMSERGLAFTRMPLAQQQRFLEFAFWNADERPRSLEELSNALLRVDYSQPGGFQWKRGPDASRWVVPLEPDWEGQRALLPPVRELTREAALAAARRNFPPVTEGMLQVARRRQPRITAEEMMPQASQIYPSELGLTLVYIPGLTNSTAVRQVGHTGFSHRGGGG